MVNLSHIFVSYYKQIIKGNGFEKSVGIFLFLLIPLSVSFLFFQSELCLESNMINALITSVSIFAGLLLNLLVLVYDMAKKNNSDFKELKKAMTPTINEIDRTLLSRHLSHEKNRSNLLRNIFVSISYCVVISIFSIILLTFSLQSKYSILDILTCLVLTHLVMAMLNVIRNVYIIFYNLPSMD